MNRYRSYAATDDQPQIGGDTFLVGVNSYDAAFNLQEGQVQAATNIDFTNSTASTRGGFVALPGSEDTVLSGSWTAELAGADSEWNAVTYGNGVYVAVADVAATGLQHVMTSTDAISWTARNASVASTWNAVAYGGGVYAAVSNAGLVMSSPDAINWTTRTASSASPWTSMTYGAGIFLAVATAGASSVITPLVDESGVYLVDEAGQKIVAVEAVTPGVGQQIMSSTDGIDWEPETAASSDLWSSVVWGNEFVAVATSGGSGRVMTSANGVTWVSRSAAASLAWRSVTYGDSLYVAVASSGSGNRVMTSTTGQTWTSRTSASNNDWYGVSYGNGKYTAVSITGTSDRIMSSENGITWVSEVNPYDYEWTAVGFGNSITFAVSQTGVNYRVMITSAVKILASGVYSDPNSAGSQWIVVAGAESVAFHAYGQSKRIVFYPAGVVLSEQGSLLQANNYLFLFMGIGQTPLRWEGIWSEDFEVVPDSSGLPGFSSIPQSNQATYYQNRLWVVNGKDEIAASDVLVFTEYDNIANSFNLNTGSGDYVVASYPFGTNSLVVFKHSSSLLLANVEGSLSDVTSTEIIRNLGLIGINAVTSVGPDLVYMSDRNVTSIKLNLQNELQASTEPLSRNIASILKRINWEFGYKIALAYWDNKLYVSLPLDNSHVCNSIAIYNFITKQWYGEWTFDDSINMAIQGFVLANYQESIQLHCVSEDGRVFVTGQGQNDISGTVVAEIATSITTRAYQLNDNSFVPRRMYMDLSTNRPNFSVTAYSNSASDDSAILTNQTYSRATSWLFADSSYSMNNSNNDYNRSFRQDYSTGPDSVQSGTGFLPEMTQNYRYPLITRKKGMLAWFKVVNTSGFLDLSGVGVEARSGDRGSQVQVG